MNPSHCEPNINFSYQVLTSQFNSDRIHLLYRGACYKPGLLCPATGAICLYTDIFALGIGLKPCPSCLIRRPTGLGKIGQFGAPPPPKKQRYSPSNICVLYGQQMYYCKNYGIGSTFVFLYNIYLYIYFTTAYGQKLFILKVIRNLSFSILFVTLHLINTS